MAGGVLLRRPAARASAAADTDARARRVPDRGARQHRDERRRLAPARRSAAATALHGDAARRDALGRRRPARGALAILRASRTGSRWATACASRPTARSSCSGAATTSRRSRTSACRSRRSSATCSRRAWIKDAAAVALDDGGRQYVGAILQLNAAGAAELARRGPTCLQRSAQSGAARAHRADRGAAKVPLRRRNPRRRPRQAPARDARTSCSVSDDTAPPRVVDPIVVEQRVARRCAEIELVVPRDLDYLRRPLSRRSRGSGRRADQMGDRARAAVPRRRRRVRGHGSAEVSAAHDAGSSRDAHARVRRGRAQAAASRSRPPTSLQQRPAAAASAAHERRARRALVASSASAATSRACGSCTRLRCARPLGVHPAALSRRRVFLLDRAPRRGERRAITSQRVRSACTSSANRPAAHRSTFSHFLDFGHCDARQGSDVGGRVAAVQHRVRRPAASSSGLRESGHGALFIGSHLGNLEVLRAYAEFEHGIEVNALVLDSQLAEAQSR